jgi:hypothetical protein
MSSANQEASGTTRSVEASDLGLPSTHCRGASSSAPSGLVFSFVRTTRTLPTVAGRVVDHQVVCAQEHIVGYFGVIHRHPSLSACMDIANTLRGLAYGKLLRVDRLNGPSDCSRSQVRCRVVRPLLEARAVPAPRCPGRGTRAAYVRTQQLSPLRDEALNARWRGGRKTTMNRAKVSYCLPPWGN